MDSFDLFAIGLFLSNRGLIQKRTRGPLQGPRVRAVIDGRPRHVDDHLACVVSYSSLSCNGKPNYSAMSTSPIPHFIAKGVCEKKAEPSYQPDIPL
jgi:hypothetical protein